jgi:hypothetical protein
MGHHPLAKEVRAEDSGTIFDLFSHPKVVEGGGPTTFFPLTNMGSLH